LGTTEGVVGVAVTHPTVAVKPVVHRALAVMATGISTNLDGDGDEGVAVVMDEDTRSGTIGDMMIAGVVVVRMEVGDEIGAEVEHLLQEGVVALVVVKVLQKDGLRLSSGIVNVRNVKLLKAPLPALLLEENLAPHLEENLAPRLEENLQLMITNRGGITLVKVIHNQQVEANRGDFRAVDFYRAIRK